MAIKAYFKTYFRDDIAQILQAAYEARVDEDDARIHAVFSYECGFITGYIKALTVIGKAFGISPFFLKDGISSVEWRVVDQEDNP